MFLLQFVTNLVCALCTLALPVLAGAALQRVSKWRFFRMGALCFVASQVLHVPFNAFILQSFCKNSLGINPEEPHGFGLVMYAIALGLSAGVFEETARWIVYRFWISSSPVDNKMANSVMLGAGHGGCEAALVGIGALVALVAMTVFRNVSDLSTIIHDPETLEKVQEALDIYWNKPWYAVMMVPLERIMAMTIHVACSLMVWNGFITRERKWICLSIAFHSSVDAVAVLCMFTWGVYALEGILLVVFLPCAIGVILYFYKQTERRLEGREREDLEAPLTEGIEEYHEFPTEEGETDMDGEVAEITNDEEQPGEEADNEETLETRDE